MSQYSDRAVKAVVDLVRIPSVEAPALPNAPFGAEVRRAHDAMLALARAEGFSPVDVNGYAGYLDIDVGADETVGVLCHLDVVPLGNGWTHAQGEVSGGRIWGRGATDDKGPAVASLYAFRKLVDEGFAPTRNLRLIWGCNEETGSKCMDWYAEHVGMPEIGFSPDGDFPLISCEKTILHVEASVPCPAWLVSWTAGERPNVVPAESTLVATRDFGSAPDIDRKTQNGVFCFSARGTSAHAATPDEGDNAAWKLAALLRSRDDAKDNEPFDNLLSLLSPYALEILGLDRSDEQSGAQTVNIGMLRVDGGTLTATFDFRCPVSQPPDRILRALSAFLGTDVRVTAHQPYLLADRDSELYRKLYGTFADVYGTALPPVISGGGTYARHMPCGVAFGPYLPGDDTHIHDRDESIGLDRLDFLIDVYAEALRRLGTK